MAINISLFIRRNPVRLQFLTSEGYRRQYSAPGRPHNETGMKKHYQAVLAGIGSDQIDVAFPDFPGCVTVARTIEEAQIRAGEVIAFHVAAMIADGDLLPAGGNEEALLEMVNEYEEEGHRVMIAAIPVEIPSGREAELAIRLPEHILNAVDEWTRAHGETRDVLLANAALDYIARHR